MSNGGALLYQYARAGRAHGAAAACAQLVAALLLGAVLVVDSAERWVLLVLLVLLLRGRSVWQNGGLRAEMTKM